ncbi:uncharacterized protein A1O9_07787 [Exophiala aquamarina CBS 119918]|uniref:Uncharacterized protein n=1 Tax=Exophiala aquamarina CBS 119918 TaxID=1182545 RepID=A0A072P8L7_9EURO|nr:uncharacterized protein A1O9_07787 [Exophiala aquamarina CBS 119918]KEF56206.1 hypothetical protein A1O9_07787 [Exophiala aquamarina CBS 119918]
MPMVWDANADARLFAAFLATSDVKPDYPALASRMGDGCTAKAVIHRIGKIKAIGKITLTEPNTNRAASTPGGKKRVKTEDVNGAVYVDHGESPTKKAKARPAQPKAKAKAPLAPIQTVKEEEERSEEDEATAASD